MIEIVKAVEPDLDDVRVLFRAYAASLGFDIEFQGFAAELRDLPGCYGPPGGVILLAKRGSEYAGCVALRSLGEGACEMKRLYVLPEARGLGAGRSLAEAIVEQARELGYTRMLLDTVAAMLPARRLYESIGFRETEPYCHNPLDGATYYELRL